MPVYEEIIAFIAAGPSTKAVAAFQPSVRVRRRVADLVRREKEDLLSAGERAELEHCLMLEHLMRLAKARARHRLTLGFTSG